LGLGAILLTVIPGIIDITRKIKYYGLSSVGWTLQMVILPKYFWQAGLVAIAAAFLAGIYPAWRLGRMNIATAIRQE
jgi:ABC-type antimicrobial peptide transport system permease subunit